MGSNGTDGGYVDQVSPTATSTGAKAAAEAALRAKASAEASAAAARSAELIDKPATPPMPNDVGVSSRPVPAPVPAPTPNQRDPGVGPADHGAGGNRGNWAGPDHGSHENTA